MQASNSLILAALFDRLAEIGYAARLSTENKTSPEAIILAEGATGEAGGNDSQGEPKSKRSVAHGK